MTFYELQYITSAQFRKDSNERIYYQEEELHGIEHPFWSVLNAVFPPTKPWLALKGREKGALLRAAKLLHEKNIPYGFYAAFLEKFNKGYLKRQKLLSILSYKGRDRAPILKEYLDMMAYFIKVFKEHPITFKVNDALYAKFPDTYKMGIFRYIYIVGLIRNALSSKTSRSLFDLVENAGNIQEILDALGGVWQKPIRLDLSGGVKVDVKGIQKEMQIRVGKEMGTPNPNFDKYFKKDGTLGAQGLKLISA